LAACAPIFTSLTAHGGEPSDPKTSLRGAFESVRAAVVRIAVTERGNSGTGVIVTRDGHIVLQAVPHLHGKKLFIFLPDGTRANGILLGWSTEWNVSVAKITDEGPWPFVELSSLRDTPRVNDSCFTVGYTLEETGWTTSPEQRIGQVSATDNPLWFRSTIKGNSPDEPLFTLGPVFDADGKMLGSTAVEPVGQDSIQLHAHQIQTLLSELTEHGNVDKRRLFGEPLRKEGKRPYIVAGAKSGSAHESADARRKAIECTVGLRSQRGKRFGSAIIVSPNGWVATCAHGGIMRGDRFIVELPDGRNANGRVTGASPIADIAVIKIEDEGPWPFAPLADSSDLPAGTPCWFVGYPADRKGREPLARRTTIVNPKGSGLSHQLYTHESYSQYGGDSGGGVFDMSGRLLALNEGKGADEPGRHPRVETLRIQWTRLAGETLAE
jgi:S1-C subfamily serine protease